jgi:hypothetical protein
VLINFLREAYRDTMTTQLIQCPACGAPVIPHGSDAVVYCSYCRASVVVPEELQVSEAAGWSMLMFDSFTANDNRWRSNDQADEYFSKFNQGIAEGRYRWEGLSRRSCLSTAWLMGYPVSDFHLIVNGKHIRGSRTGSGWGVVFRVKDNQNCYWFRIMDSQFFSVWVVKESQWQSLVDSTRTDAIKPYGVNQLEVIANGSHFVFLINGQVVGEIEAEHFPKGLVGVAIEVFNAGEETTFDFLDLTLRAP